jgi:hypothetical protein
VARSLGVISEVSGDKPTSIIGASGIKTIGIRSSLSNSDMIAAAAFMTAKTFDDPELMKPRAATMNW